MMNRPTSRKLLTCHSGARTAALCWMSPNLRSWFCTLGGHNNIRGRTLHWGLMGLLWRGWAPTGTWESTWNRIWLGLHTLTLVRKAKQRLCPLRQLRKFRVSRRILQTFYAGAVESILTQSITAWFGNSTSQDRRALQRVVRLAECTIGTTLPTLQDLYSKRCRTRACRIMKDPHHPHNKLFQLLRSGKRLRSHAARTERLPPPMHTFTHTDR